MATLTIEDLIELDIANNEVLLNKVIKSSTINNLISHIIETNNVDLLKILLEKGADIKTIGYIDRREENLPIQIASRQGKLEIVKLLIKHGVDVKTDNNYAIRAASQNGHLEVVKLLIENGADVKVAYNESIRFASANGHSEIVKVLLAPEHGADVQDKNNWAIRHASQNGHLEVVKLLIEHGADVKADNNYAIRYASQDGHLEVVKLLIEHGADVQVYYNQPIKWASANGHSEVVKLLMKYGAELSKSAFNQAADNVKEYLTSLKHVSYFGIVSEDNLGIKLPDLLEIVKNNKYYYVYKCIQDNTGYFVEDHINKYKILSAFGTPKYFNGL